MAGDTGGEYDNVGITAYFSYFRGNGNKEIIVTNQVNYQTYQSGNFWYDQFRLEAGMDGRTKYSR